MWFALYVWPFCLSDWIFKSLLPVTIGLIRALGRFGFPDNYLITRLFPQEAPPPSPASQLVTTKQSFSNFRYLFILSWIFLSYLLFFVTNCFFSPFLYCQISVFWHEYCPFHNICRLCNLYSYLYFLMMHTRLNFDKFDKFDIDFTLNLRLFRLRVFVLKDNLFSRAYRRNT